MRFIISLLLMLIMSVEANMPVFQTGKTAVTPRTPQTPAWLNQSLADQYAPGQQWTAGYGQGTVTSGSGTIRRGRGAPGSGVALQAPPDPLLNTPMSGSGTVRRGRGAPGSGVALQGPEVQTYIANPQTYTNPPSYPVQASWLAKLKELGLPYGIGGGAIIPNFNTTTNIQPTGTGTPEQPWRKQNPDGTWAYLQADGTYATATGTAGGDPTYRNSFVNMAPLQQLEPPPVQSGFGSQYSGWGRPRRGGGGGGGYSNIPSWYLGLNNWNFNE